MQNKKIEIVGAGLAGLVAGTNLAREGFEVIIYERQKQIGGRPTVRPDPAGSPFNLALLSDFIGIDISPACRLNKEFHFYIWGKKKTMNYNEGCKTYMIERGARETSLDNILLKEAKKAGVQIQYGHSMDTRKKLEDLPENSIITVGLEEDGYQMMGQPASTLYGYYARAKSHKEDPEVCLYFDSYTKDYGFTSNINGCCFAFLIGRDGQVPPNGPHDFKKQVEKSCDYPFKTWQTFESTVLPHTSPTAPRLFWRDKILAGTVSGMMDPILYFGMLSAMVSGKIAANAVTRPKLAKQQFKTAMGNYKHAWRAKNILNKAPDPIRKRVFQSFFPLFNISPAIVQKKFWGLLIPGYDIYG